MIYLILSIAASSLIFVIFKLFEKYKIDTLQAIVTNYIVACICGCILYSKPLNVAYISKQDWLYGSVLLGFIFISVFTLMAITTQKNGLSVAAVATKMSIAIPIVFGIIVYKESTGFLKISGIIIAFIAVYLTSIKNQGGSHRKNTNLLFPLLVFIGSGIIDTSLKYIETNYVETNDVALFSASIFGFAAIIGLVLIIYKTIKKQIQLTLKNVIAGILLGVPNYFSVFFLIKTLQYDHFDSSTVFTITNVAILVVSTLAGILLFKENLMLKNWIGIFLALMSITLVTLALNP